MDYMLLHPLISLGDIIAMIELMVACNYEACKYFTFAKNKIVGSHKSRNV